VHKVSPHGKLPVPNDEDYNFNTNTYDGEFYQEEGLQGRFKIDLTEAIGMDVDNDWVDDEDDGDDVQDVRDLLMIQLIPIMQIISNTCNTMLFCNYVLFILHLFLITSYLFFLISN
jgi:hypothetical protein